MAQNESAMAIIQASAFYDQDFGGPEHGHIYGLSGRARPVYRDPVSPEKAVAKNFTLSNSSTVSSPSSTNSNGAAGLGFPPATAAAAYSAAAVAGEEGHSVISFKPEFGNFVHVSAGSLLSFDQSKRAGAQLRCLNPNPNPKLMGEDDDYPMWDGEHDFHYQSDGRPAAPPETSSSHHAAAEQWGWLNDHESSGVTNGGGEETGSHKRPCAGENLQAAKKQCVSASKKAKPKSPAENKDPQSVAAKNRRERISERLKILQELVPNGSKVDLVTMLEKAISYVKFLQLQVKVLATDEFWPAQGGKAPDLSQVREAIDAILASQRDRKSSSK